VIPVNGENNIGTDGDDLIVGQDDENDALSGRAGDDSLLGGGGNDILDGGLGNDFLRGGEGDDLLIGGPGADILIGDAGADEYRFTSIIDRGDWIEGFNANEGDVLNFADLLGNDAGTGSIEDFVSFTTVNDVNTGPKIEVAVDVDGAGEQFTFVNFLTLSNPVGVTTAEEAAANGTLIT
jgi:Ca2+-binding RTX toxin-like protein